MSPAASGSANDSGHLGFRIVNSAPEHVEALEELQRVCFPGLAEEERMKAAHFLEHQRRFPEGEFVALISDSPDGEMIPAERVVGLGSGFLIDFDLANPDHSFSDIIAGGSYANHDPDGDWYYGADISVHPDYRGRGIGRRLYQARQDLVRRLGKRGIVAGGALPGYRHHSSTLSVEEYVAKIAAGELYDPTLAFQLANGFEVLGVIRDYLTDEHTDNAASLIVWRNPDALPDAHYARPARAEDAAGVTRLIMSKQRADLGVVEVSEADVLADWAGVDLDTDTIVVAREGTLRACADLLVRRGQLNAYPVVDPDEESERTRRGLLSYLSAWAEARAAAQGQEGDADTVLRHHVVDTDHEYLTSLEVRGYAYRRSVLWLERELGGAGEAVGKVRDLPPGIGLRTYRGADDEPALYQAFEEGSRDMNGRSPNTMEQWLAYVGAKDPELVFLAEYGGAASVSSAGSEPGRDEGTAGAIVGVLIAGLSDAQGADTGPGDVPTTSTPIGHVDSLRVVPEWRRRGIGSALLRRAFAELGARAAVKVGLSVDAASPTGAPDLYLNAGMHVVRRYLVMEKLIPGYR